MLYLVDLKVRQPETLAPEEWEALTQAESDYGMQARRQKKQLNVWRKAGAYATLAVWDVEDHEELHSWISGLPLFQYLDITVTPLVVHPSTIRWEQILASEANA